MDERPFPTITANEMRGINRSAVLNLVRQNGPIARTDIAAVLQISLMTVIRIVDELIANDFIRLTGKKEFSGGRRRPLLEFNSDGHLVIGVNVDENRLYGAVADLAGKIITEISQPQEIPGKIQYQPLESFIESLIKSAQETGKHILGIGVGAPGITFVRDGTVCWTPTLEWRDIPVKEKLQDRFHLPVIMDNDVNLAALGEMWFGAGQNCSNLVLMIVGRGIGAGVIIDGAVYRGSHLTAGEIGFLLPDRSHLGIPREGIGALESLASCATILEKSRLAVKARLQPDLLAALTIEDVFAAYRREEEWSQSVITDFLDHLAQTIAAITVCYDPESIILSGEIAPVADILIEPILKRLEGVIPVCPRLVVSKLEQQATILGTILEILHTTADFYTVRKLS